MSASIWPVRFVSSAMSSGTSLGSVSSLSDRRQRGRHWRDLSGVEVRRLKRRRGLLRIGHLGAGEPRAVAGAAGAGVAVCGGGRRRRGSRRRGSGAGPRCGGRAEGRADWCRVLRELVELEVERLLGGRALNFSLTVARSGSAAFTAGIFASIVDAAGPTVSGMDAISLSFASRITTEPVKPLPLTGSGLVKLS